MKNEQTQPVEILAEKTKRNSKNRLSRISLGPVITGAIIALVWIIVPKEDGTKSSVSQIQAQMKFQDEMVKEQEQFQKKVDALRKEGEQKNESKVETTNHKQQTL